MVKLGEKEKAFIIKFTIIFVALETIIFFSDLSALQGFFAAALANFFGLKHEGTLIFVNGGAFEIVPSCIGTVSASILAGIVFGLKKPEIGKKILIFLLGVALLAAMNYFRVLFVIWTGIEFGLGIADAVHVLTWLFTTVLIIGTWFVFTKKISGVKDFRGFL